MRHHSIILTRGLSIALIALLGLLLGAVVVNGQVPPHGVTRAPGVALGTAFNYQGHLKNGGNAYSGACDFQFNLYDAASAGTQIGSTQTASAVSVSSGYFITPIDFGANRFTGDARWLDMSVRCPAGSGSYTPLLPRQELTATPYALHATTAGYADAATTAEDFSGFLGGDVTGAQGSTTVTKLQGRSVSSSAPTSGQVLKWTGSVWAPGTDDDTTTYWSLTGNSGTTAGTNFVGTTDFEPLDFKVANVRALRLAPNGVSPIVIGGHNGNSVTSGTYGATIGGGGTTNFTNRVTDNYGTVGGGYNNRAGDAAGSTFDRSYATVGGGKSNSATGDVATVGGGEGNNADGSFATVGGGYGNSGAASHATVGGGYSNNASGNSATIAGGRSNTASGVGAFVGGGGYDGTYTNGNEASGVLSVIGGGYDNSASNTYAVVSGGVSNSASGYGSVVLGGTNNSAAMTYTVAAGRRAKANHEGAFVWADSTAADFVSSANNQFLIRASGGLGVGTSSPTNQLHVVEAIDASATPGQHVALFENNHASVSGSQDVLALRITNVITPGASNNFISFFGAGGSTLGSIEGNGSGSVVLSGAGADYAEWLPRRDSNETLSPGDIVGVMDGQVTKSTRGATQWMVVSNNALVAGNDPGSSRREGFALVAFVGQVPVHVRGVVRSGDFIVPSGAHDGAGVAVAPEAITPEQFAQVVGQAWETSLDPQTKTVRVAIGLTRSDPALARLVAHNQNLETRIAALERQARGDTFPTNGLLFGVLVLGGGVIALRLRVTASPATTHRANRAKPTQTGQSEAASLP